MHGERDQFRPLIPRQGCADVPKRTLQSGVTLIDTIVGTSLMLLVFLGIAGSFQLSLDAVINNKARSSAIALANERMEYIRSITYAAIGTSGGIPSGTIPQNEATTTNGVTYTRRTYIEYGDDPKDGLGAADTNHIIQDYKSAKVDVSWTSRGTTRHVILSSRFESANGKDVTCSPCGTLTINAVNAASAPVENATVTIVNAAQNINLTTFTDAGGSASIIGAPVASGYRISVTKAGQSIAQTYSAVAPNTNPNPGHLTVSNNSTTVGSFAIDTLAQKIFKTWTQVLSGVWTDTFDDNSRITILNNTVVSGGTAHLDQSDGHYFASGYFQTAPVNPSPVYRWRTFTAATSTPAGTVIRFHFYENDGVTIIPDSDLPGNAAGFATSSVNLSSLSTTTHPTLRVVADLTTSNLAVTPAIDWYSVAYEFGPNPIANVPFTLRLNKTIGSGSQGTVYKYTFNLSTDASSQFATSSMEWGTYDIFVKPSSTYDVAAACHDPGEDTSSASTTRFTIAPAVSTVTSLYLAPHTSHSLLVDVRSTATGAIIRNASVRFYRANIAYDITKTTEWCGQAFFGSLTASGSGSSNKYNITVSAPGYTTYNASDIVIGGARNLHITLN